MPPDGDYRSARTFFEEDVAFALQPQAQAIESLPGLAQGETEAVEHRSVL